MGKGNVNISDDRIVFQIIRDKESKRLKLSELKLENINDKKNELYKDERESDRIYQNQEKIISQKSIENYKVIAKKCYDNAGIKGFSYNEVEEWKIYIVKILAEKSEINLLDSA